jgi:hypothetical protein
MDEHRMVLRSRCGKKKLKWQSEILERTREFGFLYDQHRVYDWKVLWHRYEENLQLHKEIEEVYESTKA